MHYDKKVNGINWYLTRLVGTLSRTYEMCSCIDYKCKSFKIFQFSGVKLVSEKYHRPNLQWARCWNAVYHKKFQHMIPDYYNSYMQSQDCHIFIKIGFYVQQGFTSVLYTLFLTVMKVRTIVIGCYLRSPLINDHFGQSCDMAKLTTNVQTNCI